ncbi:MAG: DUF2474 domain-containing protein [Alsobacter sp.]
MSARGDAPSGWSRRIAWFLALWLGGVAAVSAVAFLIRAVLRP